VLLEPPTTITSSVITIHERAKREDQRGQFLVTEPVREVCLLFTSLKGTIH